MCVNTSGLKIKSEVILRVRLCSEEKTAMEVPVSRLTTILLGGKEDVRLGRTTGERVGVRVVT